MTHLDGKESMTNIFCPQCGRPHMQPLVLWDAFKCWWCGYILSWKEYEHRSVSAEAVAERIARNSYRTKTDE